MPATRMLQSDQYCLTFNGFYRLGAGYNGHLYLGCRLPDHKLTFSIYSTRTGQHGVTMAFPAVLQSLANGIALVLTPVLTQTDVPAGADGQATAVADIVGGILSYSRWPNPRGPITLCIAGLSPMTSRIANRALVGGRQLLVSRRNNLPVPIEGCDAVFLATLPVGEQQRLLRSAIGLPVLTLDEGTNGCATGVMFCIRPAARGGMTFDLDIDAVTRSRVRVDPRVLTLGRRAVTR